MSSHRGEYGGRGATVDWGRRVLSVSLPIVALAGPVLAQLQPCSPDPDCIVIAAGGPPGVFSPGEEVSVSLTFRSAADDGQAGGPDEISAVGLSLAVPGLDLADCGDVDENGLTAALSVAPAVAEDFFVFVENTSCASRPDCLCPDEGQGRDSFINLVLSPKSVFDPEPPPVVPVLPDGELLSVRLRVRPDAPSTIRMHVYSAVDDPKQVPKPDLAGLVTAGDRLAVDQTADRKRGISKISLIDGQVLVAGAATPTASVTGSVTAGPSSTATATPTVTPEASSTASATPSPTGVASVTSVATATVTPTGPPHSGCPGDCDGDGVVRVDELVRAVAISLGSEDADTCTPADRDGDGVVSVDELIRAVGAALAGCAGNAS